METALRSLRWGTVNRIVLNKVRKIIFRVHKDILKKKGL